MAISLDIILDKLNKNQRNSQIDIAVFHEERVRFCTKKTFDSAKPAYLNTHLAKVKAKLPDDKYKNYENELSFPLPINATADVIFSELYKVWDSDSRTIEPNFSRPGFRADFDQFLEDTNFIRFFQKDGWEAYKTQPNCILTIDMPVEQTSYYPQPYINIVDISSVSHISISKSGDILELVYRDSETTAIGIDESNYYVWNKPDKEKDWVLTSTSIHGLYWCPATFLIQDALDSTNKLLKESPVTKSLYPFEKLLFRIVSGENLEDYIGYPIIATRDQACSFTDHNNQPCQNGVINACDSDGVMTGGTYACPACSKSIYNGPGTVLALQPGKDEIYDLDNAVKIISADVTTLNYKDTSIAARIENIIATCSGRSQAGLTGTAQNEKQIQSQFESQSTIIQKVQDNLEAAIRFCLDAIGTMRYGEVYTGCVVNLGSNHYLLSDTEIEESITKAVANNAPQYQIGELYSEYNHTKFKANPRMQMRMSILKRLEPFPFLSTDDSLTLYSSGKLSETIFYLKYNFVTLVARFEDENGDIVDFGSLSTVSNKIKVIQETLLTYVNEEIIRNGGQGSGVSN